MKLDSKIYRNAAEKIRYFYYIENHLLLSEGVLTCEEAINFYSKNDNKYTKAFRGISVIDSLKYSSYGEYNTVIEEFNTNQLHRALMLDLMAEMIEQGDLQ